MHRLKDGRQRPFDTIAASTPARRPTTGHEPERGRTLARALLSRQRHRRSVRHMRWQTLTHAFTLLHLVIPALHMRAIIRDLHLQRVTKVQDGDRRDVRDGETVSCHEPVFRQLFVEFSMESRDPAVLPARSTPGSVGRALGDQAVRGRRSWDESSGRFRHGRPCPHRTRGAPTR
jgi:hypothetical protein